MNVSQIESVMQEIISIIVEETSHSEVLPIVCRILIPILDELKSQYPQYASLLDIIEKIAQDHDLIK